MADRRERFERALRGCADAGVPETVDLWLTIHERVTGRGPSEARVSEVPTGDAARRRARAPRLAPDSPLGWALAALSVLILCAGVYAASGPVRELFRQGLPGTVEPGSDEDTGWNLSTQPDVNLAALRTELDQTKTLDGVRLTLDWAYADERYVAVGLHTQRLDDPRETRGPDPILFMPSLWDDTVGNEAELPPHVEITDASGQDFDTVGGGTLLGPHRTGADATFDAPEGIEPGNAHRFRLEVPLEEEPLSPRAREELERAGAKLSGKPGPFVFEFEVPVRPAPTIKIDQTVEAEGVEITLERVVDSPVLPQAVVCFEPPDDEHRWQPWLEDDGSYEKITSNPQKLGKACWSLTMGRAVEGRASVTVDHLEGFPKDSVLTDKTGSGTINPKTIRGPWTFEFEVPEAPGS